MGKYKREEKERLREKGRKGEGERKYRTKGEKGGKKGGMKGKRERERERKKKWGSNPNRSSEVKLRIAMTEGMIFEVQ